MAWICHPRIDDGTRKVEVPDEAVGHWALAGWETCDPPPPPPIEVEDLEAPETPGLSHVQPPRRRRASGEDA